MKASHGIRKILANPLVGFAVFLLFLAAGLQAVGRLSMSVIGHFEGTVNEWLPDGTRLIGLQGSWDKFNPVLRLSRVELPAGWLDTVLVELDWIESMVRNRLVFQRLLVADGHVQMERGENGWMLAGAEASNLSLDLRDLLTYTDELHLRGRISVLAHPDSALDLALDGLNRDKRHGFDLQLRRAGVESEGLRLHWRHLPHRWSWRAPYRHLEVSGALRIPDAWLPGIDSPESWRLGLSGRWIQGGALGGGRFTALLQASAGPRNSEIEARMEILVASNESVHDGLVRAASLACGESVLTLPPAHLRASPEQAQLWLSGLSLDAATAFATEHLPLSDVARQWIGNTAPAGELSDLRLMVDASGPAFAARFDQLQMTPYRGLPWLRNASGSVVGHASGIEFDIDSEALDIQFPTVFSSRWQLLDVSGRLALWFHPKYLGLRLLDFAARLPQGRLVGTAALSRPAARSEHRFSTDLRVEQLAATELKAWTPHTLPDKFLTWLQSARPSGDLSDLRLAYQGQVRASEEDRSRRVALAGRWADGGLNYHPDWPRLIGADAWVEVSGDSVFVDVQRTRSLGVQFFNSQVAVRENAARVELSLDALSSTDQMLHYVRASALRDWLAFIGADWRGEGSFGLRGEVVIPLQDERAALSGSLDLRVDAASLSMPDYRLDVRDMTGSAHLRLPHHLSSEPLPAVLFGRPASIEFTSTDRLIEIAISGEAAPEDVYRLADMRDPKVASGRSAFAARLSAPVDERPTELHVTTDLQGVGLTLPGEFRKPPDAAVETVARLRFPSELTSLDFRHGVVEGWLDFAGTPLRGGLGVRAPAPDAGEASNHLLITGHMPSADMVEWASAENDAFDMPWRIKRLRVDELTLRDISFTDVEVQGNYRAGATHLAFSSDRLTGTVDASNGPEAMRLDLVKVILPASEEPASAADPETDEDPLDPSIIDLLPAARVQVASLFVGDEDYGRWSFAMQPAAGEVCFNDFVADLKGTLIESPDGICWNQASNRSRAEASLAMGDLSDVLPLWDYEPSIRSESAELHVAGDWPGSPLNVAVNRLSGDVSFSASDGSFVEVDSGGGARRVFSLLNFTAVAKRISLNFKDIFGSGVSFESLEADTHFDAGTLWFKEPAKLKGTGSDVKLGGSVNLVDGVMNDNEMIVTLPVTDSLPWYAVYVSLANPVAGLAVLASQQVLKKPIKHFSSAKYQISGSWDDPEVRLVGIWNDQIESFEDLREKQASAEKEG